MEEKRKVMRLLTRNERHRRQAIVPMGCSGCLWLLLQGVSERREPLKGHFLECRLSGQWYWIGDVRKVGVLTSRGTPVYLDISSWSDDSSMTIPIYNE